MKYLSLLILSALLLGACNTTPEGVVNEDLSSLLAEAQASAAPDNQTPTASETGTPTSTDSATPTTSTEQPVPTANEIEAETLASGSFQNAVHKVSGEAKLIRIGEKSVLRLENFQTENGPDLQVYLIKNNTGSPQGNDFENLGKLRSTQGNLNYELPAGFNPADFKSVSIWCQPFSVNFGFAVLK